jgi:hypothetical protein
MRVVAKQSDTKRRVVQPRNEVQFIGFGSLLIAIVAMSSNAIGGECNLKLPVFDLLRGRQEQMRAESVVIFNRVRGIAVVDHSADGAATACTGAPALDVACTDCNGTTCSPNDIIIQCAGDAAASGASGSGQAGESSGGQAGQVTDSQPTHKADEGRVCTVCGDHSKSMRGHLCHCGKNVKGRCAGAASISTSEWEAKCKLEKSRQVERSLAANDFCEREAAALNEDHCDLIYFKMAPKTTADASHAALARHVEACKVEVMRRLGEEMSAAERFELEK